MASEMKRQRQEGEERVERIKREGETTLEEKDRQL